MQALKSQFCLSHRRFKSVDFIVGRCLSVQIGHHFSWTCLTFCHRTKLQIFNCTDLSMRSTKQDNLVNLISRASLFIWRHCCIWTAESARSFSAYRVSVFFLVSLLLGREAKSKIAIADLFLNNFGNFVHFLFCGEKHEAAQSRMFFYRLFLIVSKHWQSWFLLEESYLVPEVILELGLGLIFVRE